MDKAVRGREWQGGRAEAGLTIEFVSPSTGRDGSVVFCSLRPVQIPLIPRAEFVVFRVGGIWPNHLKSNDIVRGGRWISGIASRFSLFLHRAGAAQ
jgi:hypothetical protein